MRINYKILCFMSTILIFLISCEVSEGEYYKDKVAQYTFSGSSLDYLIENEKKYDSLIKVLERLPDLKEHLKSDNITFFAPPNESFEIAIRQLNQIRLVNNETPLYLEDLNVKQLDTLVSRYFFENEYLSEYIELNTNGLDVSSLKYDYPMHLEYRQTDASGFQDWGLISIIFSDTNNSILRNNWSNTPTESTEIVTENGIVYPLTVGHTFGFDDFVFRFNDFNNDDEE